MTSENRAELMRHLDELLRWATMQGARVKTAFEVQQQSGNYLTGVVVCMQSDVDDSAVPPLTPFQIMCLRGLLGDPEQLEAAVVDYCIEAGVDVVTAAYERGKRDERERCVKVCEDERERLLSRSDELRQTGWDYPSEYHEADGADRCADLIRGYSPITLPSGPPAPAAD